MKVKLINVAEYDIKEGKTTEIPFGTFVNLCGNVGEPNKIGLPKVRLFKSLEEFKTLSSIEMSEINQEENVRILSNGQFLVFLNDTNKVKNTDTNAATNTEESKAE